MIGSPLLQMLQLPPAYAPYGQDSDALPWHHEDPESTDRLYRGHRGTVDMVDVPEMGYLVIGGHGSPSEGRFAAAFETLFPVVYGAHFAAKQAYGVTPRVMPPEAVFWVDGEAPWSVAATPPEEWRWALMVMQPHPIDELIVEAAVEHARAKGVPRLEQLRYERWEEGAAAQILHVGPYESEAPTIATLHAAISAAGLRPHGRHHEIYLGDPRRTAPEKLRTLVRQPVTR